MSHNAELPTQSRTGVLLINIGTPDAPTPGKVFKYLRQFLMDGFVIDIPWMLRAALVYGAILPRRSFASAEAYKKIWSERGSPLLYHSQDLATEVQSKLGDAYLVRVGMRYQNPSIARALQEFSAQGIRRIKVFPMFPQFTLAATQSALNAVAAAAKCMAPDTEFSVLPAFYDHPLFIESFAAVAAPTLAEFKPDFILFSFHGIPERQVRRLDRSYVHCLESKSCCDVISDVNRHCYRAQSYATAHRLARRLGLPEDRYMISFQSRLGRTPWLRPYTDHVFQKLAREGVKRLAVFCPAFVADCLETLEEIALRGRDDFRALGGEDLKLIPSLNSHPTWVKAVTHMISEGTALKV